MPTVVTAIYGGYDPVLHPAPSIQGVDFVCFTDDPDLRGDGWTVLVDDPPVESPHPRMRAKWYKIMTHRELPDEDQTLWLDGSHKITDAGGVTAALIWAERTGIAAHHHPRRCVYAEAEASMAFEKYASLSPSTVEQAEHYRQQGYPGSAGLWALGSIARVRSDDLDRAMEDWWEECVRWTYQDQVSFPVVMRRHGIQPTTFPWAQYGSPWFQIMGHARTD